ncbi:MAG: D-alanine--(R)-lactate ligase [Gracilibacteraceae bacterium]|jgi:D-alanine--(R)-lactate ligase|nr:D-alanine--(R)-lactate ligase [Gracilibacteraceae bacterium]
MGRLKVAVLFGGCSEEHAISVKSAAEIAAGLDAEKYEPIFIGVTRAGAWKTCGQPRADWEKGECRPVILSPDRKTGGLLIWGEGGWQIQPVDVVFPVLHGKTGEDGVVQGLLELAGIPYVGCGVQSSVICMDKSLAYLVARSAGIATPEFWLFERGDRPEPEAFVYPVFVKPARSGSSFGVNRVESGGELAAAVEEARRYDGKVLIEQAVSGCEVGCAVLGNGAGLIVGAIDQIRLRRGFFHIHQEAEPEKGSENAIITVPAALPAEERERIGETAKAIYRALDCRGLARVDLFRREDGRLVLNEVNTMPGFTSYSRYPRMMAAAGLTAPEVIDRLISLALEGG